MGEFCSRLLTTSIDAATGSRSINLKKGNNAQKPTTNGKSNQVISQEECFANEKSSSKWARAVNWWWYFGKTVPLRMCCDWSVPLWARQIDFSKSTFCYINNTLNRVPLQIFQTTQLLAIRKTNTRCDSVMCLSLGVCARKMQRPLFEQSPLRRHHRSCRRHHRCKCFRSLFSIGVVTPHSSNIRETAINIHRMLSLFAKATHQRLCLECIMQNTCRVS